VRWLLYKTNGWEIPSRLLVVQIKIEHSPDMVKDEELLLSILMHFCAKSISGYLFHVIKYSRSPVFMSFCFVSITNPSRK